jgi:hypothetical protein
MTKPLSPVVATKRRYPPLPIALLELPFQRGENRGAVGGIFFGFVVIATDDLAPPGKRHRLRQKARRATAAAAATRSQRESRQACGFY